MKVIEYYYRPFNKTEKNTHLSTSSYYYLRYDLFLFHYPFRIFLKKQVVEIVTQIGRKNLEF